MQSEVAHEDIKRLRERLGLTQAKLAALLGKSIRTIQRWENDRIQLGATEVRALRDMERELQ